MKTCKRRKKKSRKKDERGGYDYDAAEKNRSSKKILENKLNDTVSLGIKGREFKIIVTTQRKRKEEKQHVRKIIVGYIVKKKIARK